MPEEKPEVRPESKLSTWTKKGGKEIQLNNEPATIEQAKKNGWKPKG